MKLIKVRFFLSISFFLTLSPLFHSDGNVSVGVTFPVRAFFTTCNFPVSFFPSTLPLKNTLKAAARRGKKTAGIVQPLGGKNTHRVVMRMILERSENAIYLLMYLYI